MRHRGKTGRGGRRQGLQTPLNTGLGDCSHTVARIRTASISLDRFSPQRAQRLLLAHCCLGSAAILRESVAIVGMNQCAHDDGFLG